MIHRMRRYVGSVARRMSARLSAHRKLKALSTEGDLEACVNLVYRHVLGRDADPDGLGHWMASIRAGMTFACFVQQIETSSEAADGSAGEFILGTGRKLKALSTEGDLEECVNLVYRHVLGRDADPDGLRHSMASIRAGMTFACFVQQIETSSEAAQRKSDRSDGEFILGIGELLFQHGSARPAEIEHWRKFLREDITRRRDLIHRLVPIALAEQHRFGYAPLQPDKCWIMGTDRYLTQSIWRERASELKLAKRRDEPAAIRRGFKHSGNYVVSAITSLYRGRRFLESFLKNITSQTIFDKSELIIVDANSPEGEQDIIVDYQKIYPNIIYKRIDYRVGVYDAWNIGIEIARGKYLTNANVDDVRRDASFEIQANALDRNPSTDVVYQDFLYTLDASLNFDEIAHFGFVSELPMVTPHNLLSFNSPHHAPMWRSDLHKEVGLFDTSFKSAGDAEFWLRCVWRKKRFLKISTPHVAYFQNPEGVSTRVDTTAAVEYRDILRRYSRKLISPYLLMSRQAFAASLGIDPSWDWNMSYYDIVQGQLKLLGEREQVWPHLVQ